MNPGVFALRIRLGPDWEIPTGQLEIPTGARLGRLARLGIPTGARLEKSRLGKIPTGESRLGPNPDWARLGNPDWVPTGPAPDPDWARSANTPDWEIPTEKWHASSRTDCSSRKQLRLSRDSVGQPSAVPVKGGW